jgi:excisionase family DNA binding protein
METSNLLSVKQVAFILKVHPLTIRRYINDKRLKAVKVGGNIRIEESELQNFHKDAAPPEREKNRIFKSSKLSAKLFTSDDPLLRMQGRGASLKLSP